MNLKRHREVAAIAKGEGATNVSIGKRAKHPRLCGTINGREFELVFSATPGDPVADVRIRHQLRRLARGEAAW